MRSALIGLLALLWGCGEDNTYVAPPPPSVSVSQPVRQTVTDHIEVSGNTQASNSVNLVARVEGYLRSVDFADGAFVKKGDLLFVIEPEPYEAQVQLQEATVAQQQATLASYEKFGKIGSLKQLEAKLAELRAKQEAQHGYLAKQGVNTDYENRAQFEMDSKNWSTNPFAESATEPTGHESECEEQPADASRNPPRSI